MSHTMTANDYELEWKRSRAGLELAVFLLSNSWWVMVINDSSCYLAPLTLRELHTTDVGMGFHSTKKNESLSFLFFNLAIYSERGRSCASPLLYSAVIHLKTAHYSSHISGRENADFNRLSRKTLQQINEQHGWEVGGRRDGRNRDHWQKGGMKGKSGVRWRWPTLNLFVCMVWFQKLCRKKQIILKINEYVHTCKTCTGVQCGRMSKIKQTDGRHEHAAGFSPVKWGNKATVCLLLHTGMLCNRRAETLILKMDFVFILWDKHCCLSLVSRGNLMPAMWNTSCKSNYSLQHKWYKLQPLSGEQISRRTAPVPSFEIQLHLKSWRSTEEHKLRLVSALCRTFV